MDVMRLAVLSDIHGNRWALEAVLEELATVRADAVVNLGDCFFGPLDPRGTFEILAKHTWPTVRGNQDRELLTQGAANPTGAYTLREIGPIGVDWIERETADNVAIGQVLACHGTPNRDDCYLIEAVEPGGVRKRDALELDAMLSGVRAEVVLCGHSHEPRVAYATQDIVIVNPGSVGLPAYRDDAPFPHGMESGTPDARWAVIEKRWRGWLVDLRATPYDFDAAARAADANGRPDWARWIRSGRA
jgi:putative phosphoesterase